MNRKLLASKLKRTLTKKRKIKQKWKRLPLQIKKKIAGKRSDAIRIHSEQEAARIKINAEKAQTKRLKIDADQVQKSCGAEGCGEGNSGQFKSSSRDAMRQHCGTQKHKVIDLS